MARKKRQTFEEELDTLFLETLRLKKEHPNVVDRVIKDTQTTRRPNKHKPAPEDSRAGKE